MTTPKSIKVPTAATLAPVITPLLTSKPTIFENFKLNRNYTKNKKSRRQRSLKDTLINGFIKLLVGDMSELKKPLDTDIPEKVYGNVIRRLPYPLESTGIDGLEPGEEVEIPKESELFSIDLRKDENTIRGPSKVNLLSLPKNYVRSFWPLNLYLSINQKL